MSLRVQDMRVQCETKTRDNVFINIQCSIQYQVIHEKVQEAFYKLTQTRKQIEAYVFDVIRATVPNLDLDAVFLEKEKISTDVRESLQATLDAYGYRIIATPITDIDPAAQVKSAMNEINKMQRLKEAAHDEGEAHKIKLIKRAEAAAERIRIEAKADADAKHLAGEGLARQRQAIIDGLTESVKIFQEGVAEVDARTVMDMIIITQYFDMMKDVGERSKSSVVFTPYQSGGGDGGVDAIRQGMMEGARMGK